MSMMMITMEIHGVTVQKTIPKCPQHWVRNPLCKRHPLRSCKPLSNFQVSSKRSKALFPEYLPTSIYTTMYPLGEKNGEETLTIHIYRPHAAHFLPPCFDPIHLRCAGEKEDIFDPRTSAPTQNGDLAQKK